MFTCFWRPWVETCHCAELPFFSLDWRASNWSNRTELFFRAFLVSSIVVTHWSLWSGTTSFGHCGELWQLGKLVLVDRTLDMRGELSNTRFQLTSHCQTFHCSVTHCWWQTHFVWTNWVLTLYSQGNHCATHCQNSKPLKWTTCLWPRLCKQSHCHSEQLWGL